MGSVARLCRALCSGAVVLGEFCRANRYCVGLVGDAAASRPVTGGGFALHEAFWRRVAGVSDPRVVQFPPIGGGAAVVCSGVALKSQTTSVKNTENGLLVVKWSAFWVQRCLSWCVGRTQARYCEC